MLFRVVPDVWVKREASKVEAIILLPRYYLETWSPATLKTMLEGLGLIYTDAQITAIGQELLSRGIIEKVS